MVPEPLPLKPGDYVRCIRSPSERGALPGFDGTQLAVVARVEPPHKPCNYKETCTAHFWAVGWNRGPPYHFTPEWFEKTAPSAPKSPQRRRRTNPVGADSSDSLRPNMFQTVTIRLPPLARMAGLHTKALEHLEPPLAAGDRVRARGAHPHQRPGIDDHGCGTVAHLVPCRNVLAGCQGDFRLVGEEVGAHCWAVEDWERVEIGQRDEPARSRGSSLEL